MNSSNYENFDWRVRSGIIELGRRSVLVGILNVTPDSFSDGGLYMDVDSAVSRAREMIEQGVTIIDVGGESTRPGAESVDGSTERERVLPVIEALSDMDVYVSIDTYRSETARAAIDLGADIINDVTGCLYDEAMGSVISTSGCGVILMHTNRGRSFGGSIGESIYGSLSLDSIVEDQKAFCLHTLSNLGVWGIPSECIVLDPGFGFGKDASYNYGLLCVLDRITSLEFDYLGSSCRFGFMVGTSRKRFLGVTGSSFSERGLETSATSVMARLSGASLFRVHDIIENRDSLIVADSVIERYMSDVS